MFEYLEKGARKVPPRSNVGEGHTNRHSGEKTRGKKAKQDIVSFVVAQLIVPLRDLWSVNIYLIEVTMK